MAIPLIAWGLCALGTVIGGAFGALSRQPEINNLQAQVRDLQQEVWRLNRLVDEQNRQINSLKLKYDTMQGMRKIEVARAENHLKGAIMYSYCLKEYLDLQIRYNSPSGDLSSEENQYRQCFSQELNGTLTYGDECKILRHFLREYIRQKYAVQIDNLVECDLTPSLRRAGEVS
jgi:TolA-binding protein